MKNHFTLAAALIAGAAYAAPPPPADSASHERAQELVRQLAGPRYRERELAANELLKMGRAARAALQEGKKSADQEVHTRCATLLPQALALDLAYRLDRFLKDPDGKQEHELPLWKAYREKVGRDDNAHKLYAEMVKANGALLDLVESEPTQATDRIQKRSHDVYQEVFGNPGNGRRFNGMGSASAAELSCLFFAAAQPAYQPAPPDRLLVSLLTVPSYVSQMRDDKGGTAYRKVFFAYLEARLDETLINQVLWPLCQYKLKQGADVMAKALKDGKATQVQTKASVICCIGTLGGREHVKALVELLKDDTDVAEFFRVGPMGQVKGQVKVRDVALAMTIHLSGQNPKDFGFRYWNVYPNQLIQHHQLGFVSPEDRAVAFSKWADESKK